MALTADQVARLVHGELIGPGTVRLCAVAPLESAGPGELAFLESPRYLPHLGRSRAAAVLLAPAFRTEPGGPDTRIVVPDARAAVRSVLEALHPKTAPAWGLHPTARLGPGVRWEGRIAVGAYAILESAARLGADCASGPHAVIGARARPGGTDAVRCHHDEIRLDLLRDGQDLGRRRPAAHDVAHIEAGAAHLVVELRQVSLKALLRRLLKPGDVGKVCGEVEQDGEDRDGGAAFTSQAHRFVQSRLREG